MADEAVVRIILQDGGRGGGTVSIPPNATAREPGPQTSPNHAIIPLPEQPDRYLEAEARAALFVERQHQARERRDEELFEIEARAALEVARKKQSAADDVRKAEIEIERRELELLDAEARAALEVVRKKQLAEEDARKAEIALENRERELLEIEARAALAVVHMQQEAAESAIEYAEEVFDPVYEARKRREAERRAAQVDAAYEQQYGGDDNKTQLDSLLKIANSLRGTIGGLAGTTIGAVLDVAIGFHKAQVETRKNKRKEDLLSGDTTKAIAELLPAEDTTSAIATVVPAEDAEGAAAATGSISAMEAAPIVGAAIAAAVAIDKAITSAIKGAVSGVGRLVTGIASSDPDPAVAITGMGDAAEKAGEQMKGPLTFAMGYVAVAGGEAAKALGGLMQAVDSTAKKYEEYSPTIARQEAIAEVKHTLGDLRRAQEGGLELARYVKVQADIQEKFEDIKIKLLTKILFVLNPMLEGADNLMAGANGIEAAIKALLAPLAAIPGVGNRLANIWEDNAKPPVDDPTSVLFRDQGVKSPRDD